MPTVQNLTVTISTGVGKPDYSNEISLGQVRPGLTLKYNQILIAATITFSNILSLYPWVQPVLAPGATAHIIDASTGLSWPYSTDVGYVYKIIQASSNFTEDCHVRAYMDTIFLGSAGVSAGGISNFATEIIGMDTSMLDPTGAAAHLYDVTFENIGLGNLEGASGMFGINEAVGTPPFPVVKTVKCKWCGYLAVNVSIHTTRLDCPECGLSTVYMDTSLIRRT